MSNDEFQSLAWNKEICKKYSFRGLISQKLKTDNLNFSKGGSSNDEQFHLLSNIFSNPISRQNFLEKNPIILWGITSTARIFRNNESYMLPSVPPSVSYFLDEKYVASSEDLDLILKSYKDLYNGLYLKYYYNHEQSVQKLFNDIELWNIIFEKYNIPVLWFDTFNTHEYPSLPRNFLQGGDLLTQMLEFKNIKYKNKISYHLSNWLNDDPRITAGLKAGLLNPFTLHPTKQGHKAISDILYPHIKNL